MLESDALEERSRLVKKLSTKSFLALAELMVQDRQQIFPESLEK